MHVNQRCRTGVGSVRLPPAQAQAAMGVFPLLSFQTALRLPNGRRKARTDTAPGEVPGRDVDQVKGEGMALQGGEDEIHVRLLAIRTLSGTPAGYQRIILRPPL